MVGRIPTQYGKLEIIIYDFQVWISLEKREYGKILVFPECCLYSYSSGLVLKATVFIYIINTSLCSDDKYGLKDVQRNLEI